MKKLLVLLLLLAAAGGAYYYRAYRAQAERARAAATRRAGPGKGAPQGPNPAKMDFDEICAWLSREYKGDGGWGTIGLDEARATLAEVEATDGQNGAALATALEVLSENQLIHGENEQAVESLERALELARAAGVPAARLDELVMALGVAHLRCGEADHCIDMHNAESCLFPLADGGVWADTGGALAAIDCFEQVLEANPGAPSARWLLNLAHMAAGTWPEGVSAAERLPTEVVSSPGALGRFTEVAGPTGLATFNGAGGVILDDFDNDGLLDVVTSSIFPCEPLRFYRNDGAGGFEERTEAAGLMGQLGGLNCLQADFDGDGWLDVFVLRGAWMGRRFGRLRNSLLRNVGGERFEDVSAAAGFDRSAFPTQAAAWADYDLDGDLDLYIGNELFPNELYRNEGDGTFSEVAATAGVDGGRAFTKGVAFGDCDNDGDPDLYVSNWTANRLFRNEGDGTFTEVGEALGVASHGLSGAAIADAKMVVEGGLPDDDATFATWFFDYDNDGWLDLFVGGYNATLENVIADYLGDEVRDPRRLRIYHNDGRGGFENLAEELGAADIRLPMGANFGDVDNDGWLDFYLGTGQPRFEYLLPNVLYHNVGGEAFVDDTIAAGLGHLQKGHGVAFGDLDGDGDQDLFAQMGGFYPADAFRDALFLNPGNANHWVTLVLRGAGANTRAVGARIEVAVETPAGARSIFALVGSGGSFGASSLQQEIGLADATAIVSVTVDWPAGERQVFTGLSPDRTYELVEGRADPVPLERPVLTLGE